MSTGPYSGGYFQGVIRMVVFILLFLFIGSVVTGFVHGPREHVDVLTDPKYHDFRMDFNRSTGKQVFKD